MTRLPHRAVPIVLAAVVVDVIGFGIVTLAKVALACGFRSARRIRDRNRLPALRKAIHALPGPLFAQVKVVAEKIPLVLPPRDGGLLKSRFRKALFGSQADLD